MKTSIVILNYNGKQHLKQFLPSVVEFSSGTEIIIVDNASKDDSVKFLNENYPSLRLIQLDKNYGFAEGYNQGLKQIDADIFVLLNSDVEVQPNWIEPIVSWMESENELAAVQPKILSYSEKDKFEHAGASGGYLDKYGYPFCRGRIFETNEEDKGQYDERSHVFWATGACMFIKSKAFHECGGFDGDFFAHMEEIDMCWRLQRLGYKIGVEPKSKVFHLGGGTLNYMSPFKTKLNFRNSLFMLQKNLDRNRFFMIFFRLCLDGVAGAKFFFTGYFSHTFAIIKAHFEFYGKLSVNRKKRKAFISKHGKRSAKLTGVYSRSIVFSYYLGKKKKFIQLDKSNLSK